MLLQILIQSSSLLMVLYQVRNASQEAKGKNTQVYEHLSVTTGWT